MLTLCQIKKANFRYISIFLITVLLWQTMFVSFAATQDIKISLYVKQTFELKAYLISKDFMKESAPTWKSSNKLVATVSSTGLITAMSPGVAVIVANIATGNGYKEVKVTVVVSSGVAAVMLSEQHQKLVMGQSLALSAKLQHFNGQTTVFDSGLTWSSKNTDIAKVDNKGIVTAVGPGKTLITVVTTDGNRKDTCEIEVISLVQGVVFDQTDFNLIIGEEKQLSVTVMPTDAPFKKVTYKSTHPKIVSVNEKGVVKALSVGQSMVIATTLDGNISTNLTVDVKSMLSGIVLDATEIELNDQKSTHKLTATLISATKDQVPKEVGVLWTSSDPSVATVDAAGTVKAIKAGQTYIMATSVDGGLTAKCAVKSTMKETSKSNETVIPYAIEFLDPPSTIYLGQKVTVSYKVYPENATQRIVTVKSEPASSVQGTSTPGKLVFTPTSMGRTLVTASVGNAIQSFIVDVKPSVYDMNLVVQNLDDVDTGKAIYLGQETKVTAVFYTVDIDKSEINPQTFKWNYHSDIISLIPDPKDPYRATIKLLKPVNTFVSANFFDSRYNARVDLIYEPMAKDIILAEQAQIKLNYNFKPTVEVIARDNLRYNYKTVLDLTYVATIEELYIETSFLKNEIAFEDINIPNITEKARGLPEAGKKEVLDEWYLHIDRRKKLMSMLKNPNEPYQLVTDLNLITDRDAKKAPFFEIKNDSINSAFNGKALLRVQSKDGYISKKIWVIAKDQDDEFLLMDKEGNILFTSSDQAAQLLAEQKEKEKKIQIAATRLRYKESKDTELPSEAFVVPVYQLIESGLITEKQFKGKYSESATKLNVVKLLIKAYETEMKKSLPPVKMFYFKDIRDQDVEKAYQLGIISGNAPKKFSPNLKVDSKGLKDMMNRWLKATQQAIDEKALNELIGNTSNYKNEELIILIEKIIKMSN